MIVLPLKIKHKGIYWGCDGGPVWMNYVFSPELRIHPSLQTLSDENESVPTKHTVLRDTVQLFDPLG